MSGKNARITASNIAMLRDWITPLVRASKQTCDYAEGNGNKCGERATHRLQWGYSYSYLCADHAPQCAEKSEYVCSECGCEWENEPDTPNTCGACGSIGTRIKKGA